MGILSLRYNNTSEEDDLVQVLLVTGQQLISQPAHQSLSGIIVDSQNLTPGIYFIRVVSEKGVIKGSTKIIKE